MTTVRVAKGSARAETERKWGKQMVAEIIVQTIALASMSVFSCSFLLAQPGDEPRSSVPGKASQANAGPGQTWRPLAIDACVRQRQGRVRVRSERADAVSGGVIQLLEDCDHPERPLMARAVPGDVNVRLPLPIHAAPIIAPGARVRIRALGANIFAEYEGVALEAAATGQQLRVRLHNVLHPELQGAVIAAVATGAGEVEWAW